MLQAPRVNSVSVSGKLRRRSFGRNSVLPKKNFVDEVSKQSFSSVFPFFVYKDGSKQRKWQRETEFSVKNDYEYRFDEI